MRLFSGFVIGFLFVLVPTFASAQTPASAEVVRAYGVCTTGTQAELCNLLEQFRRQGGVLTPPAAPAAVSPTPSPAAPVVAAAPPSRERRCSRGPEGDQCRCEARHMVMGPDGRCIRQTTVIASVSNETRQLREEVRQLGTRMTGAEGAIHELQTHAARTDEHVAQAVERISQQEDISSCLAEMLIPHAGTSAAVARMTATEAVAADLVRRHGSRCGDYYRAAFNLPSPRATTQVAVMVPATPPPPPAPTPVATAATTTVPTEGGPIRVTITNTQNANAHN